MAEIYGAGAAMGFSPHEVDRMSVWQFHAVVAGFVKANSPDKGGLTEGEKVELFDWIEAANSNARTVSTMTYRWDGLGLVPVGRVSFRIGEHGD